MSDTNIETLPGSKEAWEKWFKHCGDSAEMDVVNATATLVIEEREIFAARMKEELIKKVREIAEGYDQVRQPNNGATIAKQTALRILRELEKVEISREPQTKRDTCLMADCRDPQEHFCFRHCIEVFVPSELAVQIFARLEEPNG